MLLRLFFRQCGPSACTQAGTMKPWSGVCKLQTNCVQSHSECTHMKWNNKECDTCRGLWILWGISAFPLCCWGAAVHTIKTGVALHSHMTNTHWHSIFNQHLGEVGVNCNKSSCFSYFNAQTANIEVISNLFPCWKADSYTNKVSFIRILFELSDNQLPLSIHRV